MSIEPWLKRVDDLSTPTHQEAHIHHAHWLRFDPGNEHDNYTYGFTQWLWGTGDEETRADARRQTNADPKGPVYGGQTGPGEVEPVIYMIHNKTSQPLNTWMVLDVVFLHGTEAELEERTGRDHRSPTGVIFGRTFDVLRKPQGRRHLRHREGRQGGADRVDLDDRRHDRRRRRPSAPGRGQRDAREPRLGGAALPAHARQLLRRDALFRSEQVNRHAPLSEDYQMTISRPAWRAPIRKGDRLRINGKYENKRYAWYDAMSHVGLFVDEEQKPRKGCAPYAVRRKRKKRANLLRGTLNRRWDHNHAEERRAASTGSGPATARSQTAARGSRPSLVTIEGFVYTPGDRSLSGEMGAPAARQAGHARSPS